MEQNVKHELVLLLVRGGGHARGLAGRLGMNHMTVNRRLAELVEENVLDRRTEGRNMVYFLRDTIEARNAVLASELIRQKATVSRYPVIRRLFATVQADGDIGLAVLFGSYAKGNVRKGSDIDVFIETGDRSLKARYMRDFPRSSIKTGRFAPGSPLFREIVADHVIMKGVEVFYERIGLFKGIV